MRTTSSAPAITPGTRDGPRELSAQAYRQLRVLARARLRSGGRETLLDTTALVHEAYLRIAGVEMGSAEQRSFFAYASRTMRSVIVDFARKRQTECRGGDVLIVTLTGTFADGHPAAADDIVRVHEALEELARIDAAPGAGGRDALLRRPGRSRRSRRRWASPSAPCGATGKRRACCCRACS